MGGEEKQVMCRAVVSGWGRKKVMCRAVVGE
jgi:hypothetical protein